MRLHTLVWYRASMFWLALAIVVRSPQLEAIARPGFCNNSIGRHQQVFGDGGSGQDAEPSFERDEVLRHLRLVPCPPRAVTIQRSPRAKFNKSNRRSEGCLGSWVLSGCQNSQFEEVWLDLRGTPPQPTKHLPKVPGLLLVQ